MPTSQTAAAGPGATAAPPLVRLRGIDKRFPGVHALRGVDLDVRAGEVHALVGENGAGKSTLMHVLAGVHAPDAGTVEVRGEPLAGLTPQEAGRRGIAIVHQETSLFPALTVAENVFSGRLPAGRLGTVARRRMIAETRRVLAPFGADIDPEQVVATLSSAQRQLVEIARAIDSDADVLILDEPTAAITEGEAAVLFREVRRLRDQGLAVVHISHRLEEVLAIADRVTVLRDGRVAAALARDEITTDRMVTSMVGRSLEDLYGHREGEAGDVVLRVDGLTGPPRFEGVGFELRRGEILGLAGLVGAGRTEVALALFGAAPPAAGTVELDGRRIRPRSPGAALRLGIAYASEDRRAAGLFGEMSVRHNLAVTQLDAVSRGGWLSDRREAGLARDLVERLGIRAASVDTPVRLLSGGNQQKVLLAKWIARDPKVLIVDEPTKGVDVGAKAEIYRLLRGLAARGVAILMISSEMTELLGMSDRIVVMHEGRVAGELGGDRAMSEEAIMRLASGQPVAGRTG